MSQSRLTVLMFTRCRGRFELLTMAAAVRIPPISHENSGAFLIHSCPFLVTVARHHCNERCSHRRGHSGNSAGCTSAALGHSKSGMPDELPIKYRIYRTGLQGSCMLLY